jgi:hypothetical protein
MRFREFISEAKEVSIEEGRLHRLIGAGLVAATAAAGSPNAASADDHGATRLRGDGSRTVEEPKKDAADFKPRIEKGAEWILTPKEQAAMERNEQLAEIYRLTFNSIELLQAKLDAAKADPDKLQAWKIKYFENRIEEEFEKIKNARESLIRAMEDMKRLRADKKRLIPKMERNKILMQGFTWDLLDREEIEEMMLVN